MKRLAEEKREGVRRLQPGGINTIIRAPESHIFRDVYENKGRKMLVRYRSIAKCDSQKEMVSSMTNTSGDGREKKVITSFLNRLDGVTSFPDVAVGERARLLLL